jgi:hypothetical protein
MVLAIVLPPPIARQGRIIDGCVTCPWHGYQYLPDTGASPPVKVTTFEQRSREIQFSLILLQTLQVQRSNRRDLPSQPLEVAHDPSRP